MGLIGLISVTQESVQPSIRVESQDQPLGVLVQEPDEINQVSISEDSNLGNITTTQDEDTINVSIVISDDVDLVSVSNEGSRDLSVQVYTGAVQVTSVSLEDIQDLLDLYELYLGLPADNGYILSSLVDGTRSWSKPATVNHTILGLSGAREIDFDNDYLVSGVVIASSDGNPCSVKVGWTLGGDEILRLKEAFTTNRRSYSVLIAPPTDLLDKIYVTITGNANVYITAQKFK